METSSAARPVSLRAAMIVDRIIVVLGVVVAALAVATSILDSNPTSSGLDVLGMSILALSAFAVSSGLIAYRAWRQPEYERLPFLGKKIFWWLPLLVFPVCMLLSGLGVFRDARFALSREDLLAVATGVQRVEIEDGNPRRIGLYLVYKVTYEEGGYTIFDLGECGFLDHCWFAYDPGNAAKKPLAAIWQPAPHWWFLLDPF